MRRRVQDGRIYWVDREEIVSLSGEAIRDAGNVAVVAHDTSATFAAVRSATRQEAEAGRCPLVVGGDDSILAPAAAGAHDALEGSWAIIHLDAHLDLLDESPQQGRQSHSSGMRRALELARVDPSASVQVGTRNFNFPGSKAFSSDVGLTEIPATRVHAQGVPETSRQIIGASAVADHAFLAIDADVFDPAHAPGVGWHEPGGLTSRQVLDLVVALAPHVDGMCLNEVNPMTDLNDQTVILAANLLFHFAAAKAAAG